MAFPKINPSAASHRSLARNDARLKLALFALLTGLMAGLIVNGFRWVLETPFSGFELTDNFDDFEALPSIWHFLLPLIGCSILAGLYSFIPVENRAVGVPHVIDKVQNLKGNMPLKNALVQFVAGSITLLSGQSCGREGPAVHLGATSGSVIGQFFSLPNNAMRTMIACGSAAAISACFNTPIAGVIFAMEVIMMEYTVASFLPVIISSVSAAVITRLIYGSSSLFLLDTVEMNSLIDLPWVILMGIVIGTLASLFIHLQKYCLTFSSIDIRKRLMLAGLLTGTIAWFLPEIMGTGYDSINNAMVGNYDLFFLLTLLSCKLTLSAIVIGLGMPGGLIGPTLIIGGICGALLGGLGELALPDYASHPAFYVLLGMCAMMGAVLKAPLAALMATLELSSNSNLILPAMLIIAVANLTSSEIFKLESIYQINLRMLGIKTPNNLSRLLNRYGVSSIMNTNFKQISSFEKPEQDDFGEFQESLPPWIIYTAAETDNKDLPRLLSKEAYLHLLELDSEVTEELIQARSKALIKISLHATLQHAMEAMQEVHTHHAIVVSAIGMGGIVGSGILGLISTDDIMAFYKDR